MAKDPDNLAGRFETDDAGGLLTGFLAEEDEFDRRMLWRLGSWGVGAVGAVVVAVLANQSSIGWRRDQVASADLTRQAQQIQLLAKDSHSATRQLASAIDTLNGDRDRLFSRISTLEQGLESVTGAIARQGHAAATVPSKPADTSTAQAPVLSAPAPIPPAPSVAAVATTPPATAPAAPDKPTMADKPSQTAAVEASPAATSSFNKDGAKQDNAKRDNSRQDSAKTDTAKADTAKPDSAKADGSKVETSKVETPKADTSKAETPKADTSKAEAAKPDSTRIESAKIESPKTEGAKIESAKTEVGKAEGGKAEGAKADNPRNEAPSPSIPLVASKSIMAPPDPAAAKLTEPDKPASAVTASPIPEVAASIAATDDEADEATMPKVAIQRTEFGIDLGSANSVTGLRALWLGLLKSKANAPLAALRPIIVVKEASNGFGMQLRLVAGPLNDAGTAAKLCAVMTENKRPCETTIFDGQRLSVKSDDPPAAVAKPAPRRRGYAKRAAAVVVEEPKKPEASTTISSWFGRKGQ